MRNELTLGGALVGLLCLFGGIATLSLALLALFQGYGWQTAAFAGGGFYLVVWAAARLSSRDSG
jgi:hypothetical protein